MKYCSFAQSNKKVVCKLYNIHYSNLMFIIILTCSHIKCMMCMYAYNNNYNKIYGKTGAKKQQKVTDLCKKRSFRSFTFFVYYEKLNKQAKIWFY